MPADHAKIMKQMKELKYNPDSAGVCHGIAYMGMQAILASDLKTFNDRLAIMGKIELDELLPKLTKIKEKQKIKKAILTKKEKLILSIPAFFDGVMLHQDPATFSYLFEKSKQPLYQIDSVRMFPLTQPKVLAEVERNDKGELIEKVTIEKVGEFSGIYDAAELEQLFKLLRKITKNNIGTAKSICFSLSSSNHTMMLGYDPRSRTWQLINAGSAQEFIKEALLAAEIKTAFFSVMNKRSSSPRNDNTGIFTQIYAHKTQSKRLKQNYALCSQHEDWQKIHTISPQKAKAQDSYGYSWLYLAVFAGQFDTAYALLKNEAEVNRTFGNTELTLLRLAAQDGRVDMINLLLDNGAKVNHQTRMTGDTALGSAVATEHTEAVKTLLMRNANPNLFTSRFSDNSMLLLAMEKGNASIVNLLLEYGADPNLISPEGLTSNMKEFTLHNCPLALSVFREKFLDSLLKKADINTVFSVSFDYLAIFRITDNQKEALKRLSEKLSAKKLNFTALHFAVFLQKTQIIETLLDHQAQLNPGSCEISALELAEIMGYKDTVDRLNSIPGMGPTLT